MSVSAGVAFHVTAGGLGLLSGAAALTFRKGSRLHRAAGNVFFATMLAMSASAVVLASMKPAMASAVEGALVFYWVATAWATVMRPEGKTGLFEYGALFLAMATAAAGLTLGFEAMHNPKGLKDGIPGPFYLFFAGLAAFSAALDVKVIVRRGIAGRQRIVRHLWRMTTSLTFATANLFVGLPQVFPAAVRATGLLPTPVVLVFALLIFWLIRVQFTNWYKTSEPSAASPHSQ